MDEYIEREAAIKSLLNDYPGQVGYSREDAADCILYMDAADVAQVLHGRWKIIEDDYFGLKIIKCSICRKEWYFECGDDGFDLNYHYCPNCGAKMDGDEDG